MRAISTLALCLLSTVLACTYRTDLIAGGTGGQGGLSIGADAATGGRAGMGGTGHGGATALGGMPGGGGTARGGNQGSGGTTDNDRSCAVDDDCLQCVYASAPENPDQCEHALGCCGGPVMNRTTCAINEAAWKTNCADRGFEPPICPCIFCTEMTPTCKNGACGIWSC